MPYADRQQQLSYMREYMKTRRIKNRIERLKQHKARLLKRFDTEPEMKYFISREEVGNHCDGEVKRLEGLLKIRLNCQKTGGTP